jgi:ubiquinone/menaquinone biosynthesis C-methylase UbiE
MELAYYKEYYFLERNNWWFLARKEILRSIIKRKLGNPSNLRILNVGAGLGATSIMLSDFGTVVSVEYDKYCCDFVKKELDLDFVNCSATELPFGDNEFDLVCAFDVIEHIKEDKKAVGEMVRVCKKDGYTFFTVPAFMFLWSEHDLINHHETRYTKKRFARLFDLDKQRVILSSYFNFWLFFPVAVFRIVMKLLGRKKTDGSLVSDFSLVKNSGLSKLLFYIFYSEKMILDFGLTMPVGVSFLHITKKTR